MRRWAILLLASALIGTLAFYLGAGVKTLPKAFTASADLMADLSIPDPVPGRSRQMWLDSGQYSLGDSLDTTGGQAFGLIEDVTVMRDGRLAILDSRLNRVAVYSHSGSYLFSVGRPGRGPGELAVPKALASSRDNHLYILDAGNRRISDYILAGDTATQHVGDYQIPFDPRDICVVDSFVVVLGSYAGRIVHVYRPPAREPVKSFGLPFAPQNPLLEGTLSNGLLVCDSQRRSVYVTSRVLPDLRAYSLDGALQWRTGVPSFRRMVARQVEDGGLRLVHPAGGKSDYVTSLSLQDSSIIVQFGPKERRQALGLDSANTAIFDAPSGRFLGARAGFPVFIAMSGLALQPRWDPFPRLVVGSIRIGTSDGSDN
ncbi:MAG: 6-bladed beta-propeller [Gemmatimonadales bacterium]